MLRKLSLLFAACFFISAALAQNRNINGVVRDTSSRASVKNAVIALLTPKDSVLKAFARAAADGSFQLKNVAPGNYILSVTHPVFADFVDDISVSASSENLPGIALTPKSKLLEAVIVKTGSPIKLRGDTTFYTADSFKVSANANVEELLKKMPGIQVDKNGEIKAMGQTVEKVLVDGEEFFGDDPGMAVKNLRADAVKEVQVFDKKSEQSEFTGIDDGKTQKTINLKLKEDKKKGYFGKIDLAGGIQDKSADGVRPDDDRYNTNILLSAFKGKRKLSGFLLTGNTGQDRLNWQDEQKYGGSSDNVSMSMDEDGMSMYTWRGGSSDEEAYLDPQNGYLTNINAGAQYSNKFGENTFNFSPKYAEQRYNNGKQTFTKTQAGDTSFNRNSDGYTTIDRHNIKLRAIYDIKIDSANTLKLTANSNFYNTASTQTDYSVTRGESGFLLNASDRTIRIHSEKEAYSGNAIFKHKFKKARRTLTFTGDWNLLNNDGRSFLRSSNIDYVSGYSRNVDQMKDFDKATGNASGKLVYTEPLGKKYSMELSYQLMLNHGKNDQITYGPSASTKYDARIDSLTNQFRQNILQHIPSARLNYSYKKLKINAGAGVSISDFNLKDITVNKIYDRNYTNFYPSANLNYSYKSNHNLRINYSGVTRQPTLDQLQPLRKNEDVFNQYIGNPDLRPSFTNTINLSHNGYNFIKDIWMYQSLNFSATSNSITNNRTLFPNGATATQPVNTDGNYNLGFWGGAGFKAKKIDTRFNFNLNANYNHFADVINSKKSFSENTSAGLSVGASKEKTKKYDVSINNEVEYNVQNTSQNDKSVSYLLNTFNVNATIYYKKAWSLQSDYSLTARQRTAEVTGINTNILNAKLQRTFKKDEYTVYFGVFDLLKENIGIDRSFYSNTFTEERNFRLQRYFLLGVRWDFKNKAPKAK